MITPFTILYGYLLLGIHPDHTGKRWYMQIIKKARFIIIYGKKNVKEINAASIFPMPMEHPAGDAVIANPILNIITREGNVKEINRPSRKSIFKNEDV